MLHGNKINVIVQHNVMDIEMNLLDDLVDYVSEITGSKIYPEDLSQQRKDKLPIFLSRSYSIYTANILGKAYILLIHGSGEQPTPANAATHAEMIGDRLQDQAVFVFPRLDAFVRNRLIKHGVPFVVPYQHMFLPNGPTDIREQSPRGQSVERATKEISVPAQVMFLYYFINGREVEDWPLKRWSEALRYSRMSISRAWRELAVNDLCEGQTRGQSVVLRFPKSDLQTWNRAQPHLHNPVRHRVSAAIDDSRQLQLRKAGLTALAERTLISSGDRITYALALRDWRAAIKRKEARRISRADERGVVVETWRYDPGILSPEQDSVDALSLYLSLRNEADERVQGALEEMLDKFQWQM